jgi:hypothetical protein
MSEDTLSKSFDELIKGIQSLDGVVVTKVFQPFKIRLGKDLHEAMVNDVADKYIKKELNDEYLRQAKEKYKITDAEVIKEIVKRQIEKVMGI